MPVRKPSGITLKDVLQIAAYLVIAVSLFIGFRATTEGHMLNAAIHLDETQVITVAKSTEHLTRVPIMEAKIADSSERLAVLETQLVAFEKTQKRNGEKLDAILTKLTE